MRSAWESSASGEIGSTYPASPGRSGPAPRAAAVHTFLPDPPACPRMNARDHSSSVLYLLERSDVGIVHLDCDLRVVSMNTFAHRVLPVDEMEPFNRVVLAFHPERSRSKVKFMIDQAAECPVTNPPPMTMIINIPERVLLIKVSRMTDGGGEGVGYTLVFYDITESVVTEDAAPRPDAKRQLSKIPAVQHNRIVLVDADTVSSIRSEGHYTWIKSAQGSYFCNLNIGDLELRLDPELFLRVHRSHIANLRYATQIVRDDGRVSLGMTGEEAPIPVARAQVQKLMQRLGIPQ